MAKQQRKSELCSFPIPLKNQKLKKKKFPSGLYKVAIGYCTRRFLLRYLEGRDLEEGTRREGLGGRARRKGLGGRGSEGGARREGLGGRDSEGGTRRRDSTSLPLISAGFLHNVFVA